MQKVAWEAIDPMTIVKCFKLSGEHEDLHKELCTPPMTSTKETIDEDTEFVTYLENLLDIPWHEYFAIDEELEQEQLAQAPDAQSYGNSIVDVNSVDEREPADETPPISIDQSLDYLEYIQKANLVDLKLFDLLETVKSSIQQRTLNGGDDQV